MIPHRKDKVCLVASKGLHLESCCRLQGNFCTSSEALDYTHAYWFSCNGRLNIHHWDVITVFLNRYLYEEIYIQQLQGYTEKSKEHQVYVAFAMYSLKQASRTWNEEIGRGMKELGLRGTS